MKIKNIKKVNSNQISLIKIITILIIQIDHKATEENKYQDNIVNNKIKMK